MSKPKPAVSDAEPFPHPTQAGAELDALPAYHRQVRPEVQPGLAYDTVQRLREVANDVAPMAQLLVDDTGNIVQITGQLTAYFGIGSGELGRPLQDLEIAHRPFELHSCIERAYVEGRPIAQSDGAWNDAGGQTMFFDLLIVPVLDPNGTYLGCGVTFTDVTRAHRLEQEVRRAYRELEIALQELQSTNEELETTNEELRAMNEELQFANGELKAISDQVRVRGVRVAELNAFLESILNSLRGAVVMLDRDLQIHRWNQRAEDMWALKSEQILRKDFLSLDIGLPVDQLRAPVNACLSREAEFLEVILDSTSSGGRQMRVKVTSTPPAGGDSGEPQGVILVMEEIEA